MTVPFAGNLVDYPVRLIPNGDGTYSLAVAGVTALPADANLQVGNVDVSGANPVPITSQMTVID